MQRRSSRLSNEISYQYSFVNGYEELLILRDGRVERSLKSPAIAYTLEKNPDGEETALRHKIGTKEEMEEWVSGMQKKLTPGLPDTVVREMIDSFRILELSQRLFSAEEVDKIMSNSGYLTHVLYKIDAIEIEHTDH
jgi:hypothetical protein